VPDDPKAPVAIRITRPYGSEDEFLHHELDSLTRTTVTLTGAQSRPQGVVLRFEITLASGDPLLRGEGRVVAFRPASQGNDSGLTLRFTRLDARSKGLVDRAAALRDARARASMHPPSMRPALTPAAEPAPSPSPPHVAPPPARSPSPPRVAAPPAPPSAPLTSPEPLSLQPLSESSPTLMAAPPEKTDKPGPRSAAAPLVAQAPARRNELLDRLRQRAKTLSPTAVQSLLASRAKRA
jgi:molecular chaperone DnaK